MEGKMQIVAMDPQGKIAIRCALIGLGAAALAYLNTRDIMSKMAQASNELLEAHCTCETPTE